MHPTQKKRVLIDYLNMKVLDEDWNAVIEAAFDLKQHAFGSGALFKEEKSAAATTETKDVPPQAAPPVEMEIPHHTNEVMSLLKMSDEDLVDKMFPEAPFAEQAREA